MLDEFSFDHAAERIFDPRTRAYFEEVMSSYVVGNYRSATVMLWSVVVCDLVFKLEHLAEIYTDDTAQTILREIEALQAVNPHSPTWEGTLVEKVVERTGLLDLADKAGLDHIQSQRHLSAHPVIRNGAELHRPNKDDVRAMMRGALESVLTKLPLVSRRVTEQMLDDLAKTQHLLPDENSLSQYLESKYFARFHAGVSAAVFKTLWKLTFRTENEACNANRHINSRALTLLAQREKALTAQWIANDSAYYSNLSSNARILNLLVIFISKDASLYAPLEQHAKTSIEQHISADANSRLYSWFLFDTAQAYFDDVRDAIDNLVGPTLDALTWNAMRSMSSEAEWLSQVRRLANTYYARSGGFDTADRRFSQAVGSDLANYTLDDAQHLMESSNRNSQCCYRGRASFDHLAVKERVLTLNASFDFAPYGRFVSAISDAG